MSGLIAIIISSVHKVYKITLFLFLSLGYTHWTSANRHWSLKRFVFLTEKHLLTCFQRANKDPEDQEKLRQIWDQFNSILSWCGVRFLRPYSMSKCFCQQGGLRQQMFTIFSCTFTNVQTVLQLQDTVTCPSLCPPPTSSTSPGRNPPLPPRRWRSLEIRRNHQQDTTNHILQFYGLFFSIFIQTHFQQIYTWKRVQDCDKKKAPHHLKNTACLGAKMATYEINHCHSGYNDC